MESFGVQPNEEDLCALMQMLATSDQSHRISAELAKAIVATGGQDLYERCLAALLALEMRGPQSPNSAQQMTNASGLGVLPPSVPAPIGASIPGTVNPIPLEQCGTGTRDDGTGPPSPTAAMEEAAQGLTATCCLPDGSLQMEMTMLVSGFLIGPHGMSIRSVADKTGARVSSFLKHKGANIERSFVIEGSKEAVSQAAVIMLKAVCRYKELTEGQYLGQCVESVQVVEGVEFLYRPPPKRRVPSAASVRSIPRI
eukprot:evm.model.scf_1284.1 EVM.evm.TU.scf_1284.1   scf_1284:22000-29755(+)